MCGSGIVDVRIIRCWLFIGDIVDVDFHQVIVLVASQYVSEKSKFFAGHWIRAPHKYFIFDFAGTFTAHAFEKFVVAISCSTVDAGEGHRSNLVIHRFLHLLDVE